ncbi:MAG: GAF domain-containing protein [Ignavibacteria bacterium]|nr:MAG: GAF domain-containing protein [Ignavibacteria bacterium]
MLKVIDIQEEIISLEEKYKLLIKQLKELLNPNDHELSNLSNLTSALKQTFNKISWVGFYIYDKEKLYLGPFQGKVACTTIEIDKGVCGTAAAKRETIVVADVEKFSGHIACDSDSKSEIVLPIINKDGELFGVLDLDSSEYNSFNETDKIYLEEICKFLVEEILI